MIRCVRSIKISRRVFDILIDKIKYAEEVFKYKINGQLNTFNNWHEQGYYIQIYGNEKNEWQDIFIWVHQHRHYSNEIVVRWQTDYPGNKGIFSNDTYKNRSISFEYDEEHKVADYIMKLIMKHLKYEEKNINK